MPPLATLLLYLLAGTAIGLLALLSGIPAAPLAGALLGAGLVSMSGKLETATWPTGTRTILEIGIGTVIGTGLTRASFEQLQNLWRPAILITVALVATGVVVLTASDATEAAPVTPAHLSESALPMPSTGSTTPRG